MEKEEIFKEDSLPQYDLPPQPTNHTNNQSLLSTTDEVKEGHLQIKEAREGTATKDASAANQPLPTGLKHWKWWLLVFLNIFFLLSGQSAAVLLGRFYYDKGGNSKWMATLVQTAAFPILFLPLFAVPFSSPSITITTTTAGPSIAKVSFIYISLGLLVAADNWMYSYGLLYLSASTYSLVCASQLAFNVLFSYFLNAQKFTPFILNSVVLLTCSTILVGVRAESSNPSGIPTGKYIAGFICTLGASATYSLILSLMQLSFQKVLKKETFLVVLEMQIYTAAVATCVCMVGLFASGEWRSLEAEMNGFAEGKVSYVMTLVWTAVAWQIAAVGVVGLIFVVSSLFSNVISTLALPIVPVFAVIFFHDKMDGVKIVSMFLAIWGFVSYIYQHYLDDSKSKTTTTTTTGAANVSNVAI